MMIRFLNSIDLDNVDDFDLEFESILRNRFDRNRWDMVIVKQIPWQYDLLKQFIEALKNIKYPYALKFTYKTKPNASEIINLLDYWYKDLYRFPHTLAVREEEGDVIIAYATESEKQQYEPIIADFRSFLDFLNYNFEVIEKIEPVEEEPIISKKEMKKIVKEATDLATESIEEKSDEELEEQIVQIANEEYQKEAEQAANDVLKIMRKNLATMQKERERARLNRRGNYIPVDSIDEIVDRSASYDFNGKVFGVETREFGGVTNVTVGIIDEKDETINISYKENKTLTSSLTQALTRNTNVRVRGAARYDDFNKSISIVAHYIDLLPPDEIKKEEFEQSRVELHLHTNMSAMDGVASMQEYAQYAKKLGHKAIAITDHAVVQGYPDAQAAAKETGLKILYGCEMYMVDDKQVYVRNPSPIPLYKANYVVLDLETTGLNSYYDRIMEFGAVRVEHGIVTASIDLLINPERPIPPKIVKLTNITNEMLKNKPTIEEAIDKIIEFIGDAIIVTHNAAFDMSFIQDTLERLGRPKLQNPTIDTLALSRYLFPDSKAHRLGVLCKQFDVFYDSNAAHRADYDANVLNEVWQPMIAMLTKKNHELTHADLANLETPRELLKHIRPSHVTILVKNLAGLKSLFELVSLSHTEYLADVPKIPRFEIEKRRENLLIGSACFEGEVFQTALYYNKKILTNSLKFYDYIEIQPPENYSYLVNMGDLNEEEVITHLRDIIECADSINKMVVATGDVHYVLPKDKIFRDILIDAPGLKNTRHPYNPYRRDDLEPFDNPSQHFRTTQEMLDCMSFLGDEKAKEIVITNTNIVADQIESIVPLPNDKLYPPVLANSPEYLTEYCFNEAHRRYGENLPKLIEDRLNVELNAIISNNYSVIYRIAHELVKRTREDHYIVGSRGSVGSSFVATMANITEVNPLPPHYLCPDCKYIEWTSETMPQYRSGFDLPEKHCPNCGALLTSDGQNIPFETFLGFKGDKTPDIDLNFPSDYQAIAHNHTKDLLGAKNVFRAGTISKIEDKTAFGIARGYLDRRHIDLDNYPRSKISYLASGIVGVKRTTGQHPGGIVVVPADRDVNEFTPVQYPADEIDSSWLTTHFDFHKMDETLLKLDLLGHVDPRALKMMCDLTHMDVESIPLGDKKVLSLFNSPKELHLVNDYQRSTTGAMGLPEFGTVTGRRILEKAHPTTFNDLVVISGLSHGRGVWQGNAEDLIDDGIATLQEVIGCRDDIMTYLIEKNLPNKVAFSIMEDVRKGRGLKQEYVEIMRANKIPQFYIDSCNLIKYMFPKGHAVAYVTMAVRVGYFKLYYPLEYYATFFTLRCDAYDIAVMIKGREKIIDRLEELKVKSRSREKLTVKEDAQMRTLEVALEMVQRGFTFSNIDLQKSDATNFIIDYDNKALIPPFITIDGLGENNAITVIEARKDGPFLSKEDLLRRTKLTSTNVEVLSSMGVLDDLSETDQLSLFDF